MKQLKNYIGGELVDPISMDYLKNENPATGEIHNLLPNSDERDVKLAIESAQKAAMTWSITPAEKRCSILLKIADLINENLEKLALAETIDTGKPLRLAKTMDIPRASANFQFFGTSILHTASESHHTDDIAINYTLRQPIGVVGCISPWNLPLYLFTWKIAPALAAGNAVVAKPSELTPTTAYLLSEICIKAGLPPGVLNIVHGLGSKVGQSIVQEPAVKALSFTGGTATGKKIMETAAPLFKKISLELGGKNAAIVFDDCDFEKTVRGVAQSSFLNQGEICLCSSRIFVHSSIYNRFRDAFIKQVNTLVVGDPLDDKTNLGALISKTHLEKIVTYVRLAKEEGGKILTGGEPATLKGNCANGYFMAPTVIEGLSYDCRVNQEEIFGPVVTLIPFDYEEEVIKWSNASAYGLAASIWTENVQRAHRIAHQLRCGIIWVNCWLLRDLRTPFGGMNQSGIGREGGWEAWRFFTEPKNICIRL